MPALGYETTKENTSQGLEQLEFFAVMSADGDNRARVVLESRRPDDTVDPAIIMEMVAPPVGDLDPEPVADKPRVELRFSALKITGPATVYEEDGVTVHKSVADGEEYGLEVEFREVTDPINGNCAFKRMVPASLPYILE